MKAAPPRSVELVGRLALGIPLPAAVGGDKSRAIGRVDRPQETTNLESSGPCIGHKLAG